MADPAAKALKAYEEKHHKKPKDAAALVAFAKSNKELKPITQEQANVVLTSADNEKQSNKSEKEKPSKNDNTKEKKAKGGNKEEETPPPKAKEPRKEVALYAIGDEVLMSKDRMGTVKYVGEVPELGAGLWYGVELTDGSIGQSDGSVKGKRYFTTEGKRALFAPSSKIRRKMNTRDHFRHDSLRIMQERKGEPPRPEDDKVPNPEVSDEKAPSDTSANATIATEPEKQVSSPPQVKSSVSEQKSSSEETLAKSVSHDNSKAEESSHFNDKSHHLKRRSSTLLANASGVSAAEAYETLLTFILRQSEELREQLLDVYANPKLNPILVNSYSELKHMEKEEQERVWNALLTRWKLFG